MDAQPIPKFRKGQIVVKNGLRYLVEGWSPGWLHLSPARKNNLPDRRHIGFSGSDEGYVAEETSPGSLQR